MAKVKPLINEIVFSVYFRLGQDIVTLIITQMFRLESIENYTAESIFVVLLLVG